MRFGDWIEKALSMSGLSEERVRRWLGHCGCKRRKERLNQLGMWAKRLVTGRTTKPFDLED